jgi:hypothetical protein
MATPTPCICTDQRCGHNGQPCGKPVEGPQQIESGDYPGGDFKPLARVTKGICEDCWKRVTPVWDRITEKVFRIWS